VRVEKRAEREKRREGGEGRGFEGSHLSVVAALRLDQRAVEVHVGRPRRLRARARACAPVRVRRRRRAGVRRVHDLALLGQRAAEDVGVGDQLPVALELAHDRLHLRGDRVGGVGRSVHALHDRGPVLQDGRDATAPIAQQPVRDLRAARPTVRLRRVERLLDLAQALVVAARHDHGAPRRQQRGQVATHRLDDLGQEVVLLLRRRHVGGVDVLHPRRGDGDGARDEHTRAGRRL